MDEQKTIAKGAFWTLLSQLTVKVLAFVYLIIIARFLPEETVGIFYLALSVLSVVYLFTDLGIPYALNRYLPFFNARKEFAKLHALIRLAYQGAGGLTFLVSIAVIIAADGLAALLSQPMLAPLFRWLGAWLFLQEIFDISRSVLNGMKRVRESQLLEVFVTVARFVLTLVAFGWIGFTVETLVIPYLISFLLAAVLSYFYAQREIRKWPTASADRAPFSFSSLAREVVSFGVVTMGVFGVWTLTQHVDRIMLNYMLPDPLAALAVYTVAVGLASVLLLFPGAISTIFSPVISELYGQEKREEMRTVTATSMKWLMMLSLPAVLTLLVFSDELLVLFYGGSYAAGYGVVVLFTVGFFIRSLSVLHSLAIAAMRRLDIEMVAALLSTGSNIIFNVLLIPIWGIEGAALSSALSLLLVTVFFFYQARRLFGFSPPWSIFRPLAVGAVALPLLWLAKPFLLSAFSWTEPLLAGVGGEGIAAILLPKLLKVFILGGLFVFVGAVYIGALVLFRVIEPSETTLLQAALRRASVPERYIAYIGNILTPTISNKRINKTRQEG